MGQIAKRRISEEDEAWQADLIAVGTYRFLMLTISADDTSHESGTVAHDDDAGISRLVERTVQLLKPEAARRGVEVIANVGPVH